MNRLRSYSLFFAFLVTFIAAFIGMSWNMLEPRMATPIGTKVMLLVAVAMAAFSRVGGKSPILKTILVVGAAVPFGAFISMLLAMLKDPTSGNLWPIAVVTLGIVALAASAVGTALGSLVLLLVRGVSSTE